MRLFTHAIVTAGLITHAWAKSSIVVRPNLTVVSASPAQELLELPSLPSLSPIASCPPSSLDKSPSGLEPDPEAEREPDLSPPSMCIAGVHEPCELMDVPRTCRGGPTNLDLATNYTFLKVRFSVIGCNFTLIFGFQNQTTGAMVPIPMSGKQLAEFSKVLVPGCCTSTWARRLWKWLIEVVLTVAIGYVVQLVLSYLPIWGMFR
ncbi:hypothetical protein OH77DRAFT_1418938 [Trametes cingulata]|nr:hypothetical protein OH77DRAFT_1418938 [Trametes cingulata]